MQTDTRVLVVMPTYQEIDNLELMVGRIRRSLPEAILLVVDDNSPDGTGELADRLARTDTSIVVHHREQKSGLGSAYLEAFRWGLDNGFHVLIEIDADGSHPAEELGELVRLVTKDSPADLAIGSRWVPGGRVVNWPVRRQLLSRAANAYARRALGLAVADVTAGFRAYRADLLERIPFGAIDSRGYCFQIEMTYRSARLGARIVETPITFRERENGVSKMGSDIILEAMTRVTAWGAARIFQPRKALPSER